MHRSTTTHQPKSFEPPTTDVALIEGCLRKRNPAKQALRQPPARRSLRSQSPGGGYIWPEPRSFPVPHRVLVGAVAVVLLAPPHAPRNFPSGNAWPLQNQDGSAKPMLRLAGLYHA